MKVPNPLFFFSKHIIFNNLEYLFKFGKGNILCCKLSTVIMKNKNHYIDRVKSSKSFSRCRKHVIKGPARKRKCPPNIKGPGYVSTHFEKKVFFFKLR